MHVIRLGLAGCLMIASSAPSLADRVMSIQEKQAMAAQYYAAYGIADLCAQNGISFSSEELDALRAAVSKKSEELGISPETSDRLWADSVTALGAIQITDFDCADTKQWILFNLPGVFRGTAAGTSPFR